MTVPTSQTRRQPRRVAAATFVGTAVEFYDFYIYGNAAALIFGKVFFPDLDTATATILSFATLATGGSAGPSAASSPGISAIESDGKGCSFCPWC